MANTNINLVGLDFDSLKSNFKEYLKRSDSPFKDVDFEGSSINQLLDIFSYNTYLNSFYLNMVASEMFLDSATLKDSVISHAKELNYVPRSYRSAEAKVSFTITPSAPLDSLLIPKGTSFTTKLGSNNYTFTTGENLVVTVNSNGQFVANSITISEGPFVVDSFVYTSNTNQRFVLSNPTVDTRSISVVVIENQGANTLSYTKATSFLDHESNSQIYFLQAAENDQYEIIFGDNIIGKKPQNGATIAVEYRVCSGELPNGASVFFIDGPIQGQANISPVVTTQTARGGSINESIESIKFNAPRSYQNQDRAVTPTDYENLLKANFSEIEAISVYGGEDADPPQYGKVFIAVDVAGGEGASVLDKKRFLDFLLPRAVISITPEFIDPEFLYLGVVAKVRYNTNVTNLTPSTIETLVRNTISQYNTDNLNGFKKTIRCSKLAELINKAHPSILGIDLNINPYKIILPTPGSSFSTKINYGFKLSQFVSFATEAEDYIKSKIKAVYSSKFVFEGNVSTLQDDGSGSLAIYKFDENDNSVFIKNIGTIDYNNGVVIINNLLIDSLDNNLPNIHVHVVPELKDIPATRNTIITIPEEFTAVTAIATQE